MLNYEDLIGTILFNVYDKNFMTSDNLLEIFMGNKIEPRREYLLKHLAEIKIDIE